jgi:hypothetical protein
MSAPKGHNRKVMEAEQDSTCFSDLRYSASAGGVYATFAKDGSQYFYPLSRAEAREWFEDDSLGGFFNAEVR